MPAQNRSFHFEFRTRESLEGPPRGPRPGDGDEVERKIAYTLEYAHEARRKGAIPAASVAADSRRLQTVHERVHTAAQKARNLHTRIRSGGFQKQNAGQIPVL